MSVQRISLRLLFGSIVGYHYSNRGCLWDFRCHQQDGRIASLLGFLCYFSSRRRHTRCLSDWSSDVCSSNLCCPINGPWFMPLDIQTKLLQPDIVVLETTERIMMGNDCRQVEWAGGDRIGE